ncbi:TPA: helix-turn-helix domain-containing protein [Burkholderia cepacia ATCC 25416]|uniref:helix-turn-helix domain-containing protein n=1 Tax=Burkholderia cepacia TaxID=292 RepID=UPI001CF40575|nr:helix-turn-helix domain-containing protein [Burkholderia cepacia]MCA8356069.1 helix-turn-helix domain-containing protein [Burkholderia cepacia]HDR9757552.1 helix-turn-helix domain-containing protein [Burkholderia cepacia ATCC 25416]
MESIGERLREERERLGFSQTAFGAMAEVTKQSQIKYEKGERSPDAAYLAAVMRVGADVQYIVGGVRSSAALTQDEQELVARYREASLELKAAAVGALAAGSRSSGDVGRKSQVFHGSVGQNISVEGSLDQRGTQFTVKGSKKK